MTIVCDGCGHIHEMPLEALEYDVDCGNCDEPVVSEFTLVELGFTNGLRAREEAINASQHKARHLVPR
jgi:hypothetical protein